MSVVERNHSRRPVRQKSYLIVKVFKSKVLSFVSEEAIVVDLNDSGMKLHFSVDIKADHGQKFWLRVPHPENPNLYMQARAETRWYDDQAYTLGLEFQDLSKQDRLFLKGYMQIFQKLGREQC